MNVQAVITDFDGTLADTFEANLKAYQMAFSEVGMNLPEEQYRACFGFRFDDFMRALGIEDDALKNEIREMKRIYYPSCFGYLRPNNVLIGKIREFKMQGVKTAVASTARRENLHNALKAVGAFDLFDLILAGEDVSKGKPDPEIYFKAMAGLGVGPSESVIYEDSAVGIQAAEATGAKVIRISL